ncbi:hypothetical protein THAR02_11212 [Trichoderma harzianum]|uniref:Uncharacterized protein n=1 Tax=Trichoderma harzianum TaxID=5544 RepID=A0A0F9WU38_TRIHA|nr:hypothetical protein THAR02_11212 [Trichoderma harzianum]
MTAEDDTTAEVMQNGEESTEDDMTEQALIQKDSTTILHPSGIGEGSNETVSFDEQKDIPVEQLRTEFLTDDKLLSSWIRNPDLFWNEFKPPFQTTANSYEEEVRLFVKYTISAGEKTNIQKFQERLDAVVSYRLWTNFYEFNQFVNELRKKVPSWKATNSWGKAREACNALSTSRLSRIQTLKRARKRPATSDEDIRKRLRTGDASYFTPDFNCNASATQLNNMFCLDSGVFPPCNMNFTASVGRTQEVGNPHEKSWTPNEVGIPNGEPSWTHNFDGMDYMNAVPSSSTQHIANTDNLNAVPSRQHMYPSLTQNFAGIDYPNAVPLLTQNVADTDHLNAGRSWIRDDDPSITQQHIDPSITQQHINPSITQQHIDPSMTQQHIDPSLTQQATEIELLVDNLLSWTAEQMDSMLGECGMLDKANEADNANEADEADEADEAE